jgi:hypothetical protein
MKPGLPIEPTTRVQPPKFKGTPEQRRADARNAIITIAVVLVFGLVALILNCAAVGQ